MKRKIMNLICLLAVLAGTICTEPLFLYAENEEYEQNKSSSEAVGENVVHHSKEEITLYALDDAYQTYISIPSELPQSYQLPYDDSGQATRYFVAEGDSVEVSDNGMVTPAVTIWYWNGNIGSTVSSGSPDEIVTVEYNFGKSVIGIQTGNEIRYVTVDVQNYAQYYADQVLAQYVREKITDTMTDLEKLHVITAFPAQYDYSAHYSGYVSMIVCGGGDCWASSSAILQLCKMVGLPAHIRYGVNEPGAGSGHRNVAVQIKDADGTFVYIAEAGYSEEAPRYYSVQKENTGFYYSVSDGKAKIIQYDGFDTDVQVPAEIDGYPVTEIGEKAFHYGAWYSGMEVEQIILPDTIKTIGDSAFNSCKSLQQIVIPASVTSIGSLAFTNCSSLENIFVAEANENYKDIDGVLFNKAGTSLISFPAGKAGTYQVPEGVEEIGEYAFYYTDKVMTVFFPKSVRQIGEGAFENSKVQWMYFKGDMPEFGMYALRYLRLELFYPEGNESWTTAENYGATELKWQTADMQSVGRLGDVNNDGKIQADDALIVLQYDIGVQLLNFNETAADCDGEEGITAADAQMILMYDVGLITELKQPE